jgi:hypothetical protein
LLENSRDHNAILDGAAFVILDGVELAGFGALQAKPIHAEADADSIQISREGTVIPQAVEFAECLEERFLRHIFGFVPVSQEVRRSSNEAVSVTLDDEREGGFISTPTPGYPCEFIARLESRCG